MLLLSLCYLGLDTGTAVADVFNEFIDHEWPVELDEHGFIETSFAWMILRYWDVREFSDALAKGHWNDFLHRSIKSGYTDNNALKVEDELGSSSACW